MKKLFIFLILIMILIAPAHATLTNTVANVTQPTAYWWLGDPLKDQGLLWMKEVELLIDGTNASTSFYFDPQTSAPSADEGRVYYNDVAKNLKLRTDSAWVDIDVSGASSMDSAYNVGSGITVDAGAVTLTSTDAANNVVLAIVQGDTAGAVAQTIVSAGTGALLSFDSNGTGADVLGSDSTWNVTKAGVATLPGIILGGTDLVMENAETINNVDDDVIEFSSNDKEDFEIDLSGTNIIKFTSDSSAITLELDTLDRITGVEDITFDAEAGNISLTADAGTEDLTIGQLGAVDASVIITSEGTGTDAVSLITTNAAGDISMVSADNITRTAADDITDTLTDGGYTLTIGGATNGDFTSTVADQYSLIVVDTILIQNTEATKDITINSVLGSIYIEAEEDAANAILITADGGTSSTMKLHNDTGTGAASIELLTDVGGITNTASAGAIVMSAIGGTAGDVTLSAGDIMTLTSVDTKIFDGAAAETWIVEGTADDHETSVVFTDPTADVVYTFPTAAADTLAVMSSTLATNAPEIANSVTGGTNQLIFEGTADDFETIVTANDATADATVSLPNDTGDVVYAPPGVVDYAAGAGALPITHVIITYESTGGAEALTLADGQPGQVLQVNHDTDGGNGVITPATALGYTSVDLADDGDMVTFQFVDTQGWIILGTAGNAAPPVVTP